MDFHAGLEFCWFALISLACVACWLPPVRARLARLRWPFLIAALVAVAVRLLPAWWALPSDALVRWDLDSYRAVADAIANRHDVYDITGRYPYLPLHMYVFAAADWLATHTGFSFLFWVKMPAVLADAALTLVVGYAACAMGRRKDAAALAMLFALNPVSVLVTGYHGQFDAVPTALSLGAWALLTFRRERWVMPLAALLLGLAIADKTWPVLLAPILLWRMETTNDRMMFGALTALPALLLLAVYEALVPGGAVHALEVSSEYQGVLGVWGFSALLVRAAGPEAREGAIQAATLAGPTIMLGSLGFAYAAAARLRRDPERMALVVAVLYAAAAGWGTHWLAWLVPLALMSGRWWSAGYLVASALYAATVYLGFGGVLWGFTWLTNSFEPVGWLEWAGLALWGAITIGVAVTCTAALSRDVAGALPRPVSYRHALRAGAGAARRLVVPALRGRLLRRSPARAAPGNAP
jgi:hypothetical protein